MAKYRVTTPTGAILNCDKYEFLGDNLWADDSVMVSGPQVQFTIVDTTLPAPDPAEWFIDVGAFFDRFGLVKIAVLSSTDATVKAIVQDVMVRKWIDLQRPDVAAGLDILVNASIEGMTEELKTSILTTPVAPAEKAALKKLYFS